MWERNKNKIFYLGMAALFCLFSMMFWEDAEVNYKNQIQEAYEKRYQTEWDSLMKSYEEAYSNYKRDLLQYQDDMIRYAEECKLAADQKEKYDAEFQESQKQYQKELSDYQQAVEKRDAEYERLWDEKEREMLRNGLLFDVTVSAIMNWNNNVGHEWSESTLVNGKSVWIRDQVLLKVVSAEAERRHRSVLDNDRNIRCNLSAYEIL